MTFEIFLNIVIIALLTVGIIYIMVLENQLRGLGEKRREMACLMEQFYGASTKVKSDLTHMRQITLDAQDELKTQLEHAVLLKDELNVLISKLQQISRTAEQLPEAVSPTLAPANTSAFYSQNEQDLIDALNALK